MIHNIDIKTIWHYLSHYKIKNCKLSFIGNWLQTLFDYDVRIFKYIITNQNSVPDPADLSRRDRTADRYIIENDTVESERRKKECFVMIALRQIKLFIL